VAAVLPPNGETKALKRAYEIRPRKLRKPGHTASSSASKRSSGTGKPSSFSARI
jgi:hypothetical protein